MGTGGFSKPVVDWAVATRALPGETLSGDRHVVQPFPKGAMVAALDGLGHGPQAAAAAQAAEAVLKDHARDSVISLVQRCQQALLSTRGVVMSLASFSLVDSTMTWIAVGNVAGVLLRADPTLGAPHETLLLRGGVVGYQLPPLSASVIPVSRGDTLIFATDGLRQDFPLRLAAGEAPQRLADRLLLERARPTDDALVLVARFKGGKP